MTSRDLELLELLDAYSCHADIVELVTKLEDAFDLDALLALSDAACQEGACKELAFWVIPFLLRLSEDVAEEDKLHIFIEAAMIYAYSYEIEDIVPEELVRLLEESVVKHRESVLEYYGANAFALNDVYYLVAAIMTFYQPQWGASILYGNLFPYDSEIELEYCCPQAHDIVVHIDAVGSHCAGAKRDNREVGGNRLRTIHAWKKGAGRQDLLALINCRLGDNGLPAIKQFAEISKAEARVLFVVLGTMLEYAGYREEANRYYHMLSTVTCPVCKQRFVLADCWGV